MPNWKDALNAIIQINAGDLTDAVRDANRQTAEDAFQHDSDRFNETVQNRIAENVNKWATDTDMDETLQENLTNILQHAEEEGWTTEEIEKELENYVGNKAELIARTEVTKSVMFGKNEAMRENGVKLKQWVHNNIGPGNREWHQEFDDDGPIPFESKWTSSETGEELEYPGDGSAREVCNCGCTMVEVASEEEDNE